MNTPIHSSKEIQRHRNRVDACVGNARVEVKIGANALRSIREGLMRVAYSISEEPSLRGYVVLVDSRITTKRLIDEWELASSIFRSDVMKRLAICLQGEGGMKGIPRDPDEKTQRMLMDIVEKTRKRGGATRTDNSFVVLKLLLHQWLTSGKPITSQDLAEMAGCSYPALARALKPLGSLLEDRSDRKVALRYFPKEEYARLIAVSDRARSTVRFADKSGQPRSAESQVRRLEKMNPPGLAIGGVLGARHCDPNLDLMGTPRLDLSVHCPGRCMNLDFIEKLDPGLERTTDPRQPACLVIHAVRHYKSLFTPRNGGLAWADPVECLLDLHEMHLESQAREFLLSFPAAKGQI